MSASFRPSLITPDHFESILRNNAEFVHWLSPLDAAELTRLLDHADYARQAKDGEAVLIGYDGNGPYRHKNVDWLSERFSHYFYIDRIIIGASVQGLGLGRALYDDIAEYARSRGFEILACEVNTAPDNPVSHAFHQRYGFRAIGEAQYAQDKSVRYYRFDL